MKLLFLIVSTLAVPVALAEKMEGFAANYYQDDPFIPSYSISKNLAPEIIIGNDIFFMEFSSLTDIAKRSGAAIHQDNEASWLCLTAKSVNYWFISDNEMGQGDLTSIGISQGVRQQACSFYNDDVRIKIDGVPLLNASLKDLSMTFPDIPNNDSVQYCAESQSYGEFIQLNCLHYFFKNKKIKGIFISQITSS
ncbi:MAG: hypothetical protein E6868_15030 [Pantoea sp.]|uniref:hypothetical protein n=2 Tax=Pantoea TaxID=53335 RepID=UPI002904BE33|nr:hypothetical protein [Pantoea sp.]MDU1574556.1 hypothetical protein [Pantoea sp.]